MAPRASQNKKGSGQGAGCLIWIAIFLFIALLFLLNRNKIEETLKRTDFMDLIKTRMSSPSPSPRGGGQARPSPSPEIRIIESARPRESERPESPRPSPRPSQKPSAKPSEKPASPAPSKKPAASEAAPSEAPKFRKVSLYFVQIDDEGKILIREAKRAIPTSDSPLTDALNALVAGPSADDIAKGLVSVMPKGSRLLSVVIRGSTAYVDFNEAFMFNTIGIDGYIGQLKQVVWTATSFPTVKDVQIIIEGKKIDYLGSEGVFIGLPLSRNTF